MKLAQSTVWMASSSAQMILRPIWGFLVSQSAQPVRDAISKGLADIKVAGKAAGLLNFNPEEARALFAEGFNFIAVGSDGSLLIRRTEDLLAEFLA